MVQGLFSEYSEPFTDHLIFSGDETKETCKHGHLYCEQDKPGLIPTLPSYNCIFLYVYRLVPGLLRQLYGDSRRDSTKIPRWKIKSIN